MEAPVTQNTDVETPKRLGRRKGTKNKRPSPLKGRKLGPRKPKPLVIPLSAVAANPHVLTPDQVKALLEDRAKNYGTFVALSKIVQALKSVIYQELGSRSKALADDQIEALDMICHKIARIINGDADHIDSWQDIAGYARLVAERLQGRTL
jgi:hypothetical protein